MERNWLFQKADNKNHCCVAGYFSLVLKQPEDIALKWWFRLLCSPWSLGSFLCSPVSVIDPTCGSMVHRYEACGPGEWFRASGLWGVAGHRTCKLLGGSHRCCFTGMWLPHQILSVSRKLSRSICKNLPISACRQLMQRKSKRKVKHSIGRKANTETSQLTASLRQCCCFTVPITLFLEHCFGAVCIHGRVGLWFSIYFVLWWAFTYVFHTLLRFCCAF